jgi:large subunit ribosomal protein L20
MVRITRGSQSRLRHKKILNSAKGYRGSHSKLFRTANQQVMKGLLYSYAHRRKRKHVFRSQWITQINAFANQQDTNYSQLISKLKRSGIGLNRKLLAQLANFDLKTLNFLITQI